jgi:MoxR-like ATPase
MIGSRRTNLPARLSTFGGRESEMRELGELLASNRLVTVTGAGGCGKTRLAYEVASEA